MRTTKFADISMVIVRMLCLSAALAGVLLQTAFAHSLGAHVHGVASLEIAVDGDELSLDFSGPLDNLIGFEHAPQNDKQKGVVKAMEQRLRDAANAFVPSPAAACTAVSVKLESSVLDGGKPEEGGHADIDGEYKFKCARPENLRDLEVRLFDAFPKLRVIKVQVAGPRGQASAKLSQDQRKVKW
jgi:hypothetical protein